MRRGFTLIELLISIALVLLLMIGINQVFKVTGEIVGTSNTIADAMRDARAAQAVMQADFTNMLADGPCLIIRSQRLAAFRDRKDELGDRDYDPTGTPGVIDQQIRTIDLDGNNDESDPGDVTPRAIYGVRNRRIDQMNFFARGNYPRQTGNDGTFVAPMTSNEAWIWYGHVKQPGPLGTPGTYIYLGTGQADGASYTFQTNPNNFYSSQWILGRMVMLLRAPDASGEIKDDSTPSVPQFHIATAGSPSAYPPLGQRSVANDASTPRWEIQWSRYDLAGTTIQQFKNTLTAAMTVPPDFFEGTNGLMYRFQGSTIPTKPLSSEGIAKVSPALLQHCSQLIIEYAGNFLSQDNDPTSATFGEVTDIVPDSEIDFIVNPITRTRSIRWYGFPRDTSSNLANAPGRSDGRIEGWQNGRTNNQLPDVVPLRDIARTAPGMAAFPGFAFERDVQADVTPKPDYASPTNGVALNDRYVCAWGPDTTALPYPKMIRFVFTIDDPTGRVVDGQTYEFVFRVGG